MIQTECKGCGQKLKVPEDMAGKKARCPSCGDPVKIPGGSAPASSPERPPAKTPPPSRPPSAIPIGRPVAPPPMPADNPFDFTAPAAAATPRDAIPLAVSPPPAIEPPADEKADIAEAKSDTPPHSASRLSMARLLATSAAILGAITGAGLLAHIEPSEDMVMEFIGRHARGSLTAEHLTGALIGLIAGLLLGWAVIGLVGRSRTSAVGAVLLTVSGVAYGATRKAAEGELSWFLVLSGAFLGAALAAGVGALLGAVFDLMRGKK
jgi:hypothetical protein